MDNKMELLYDELAKATDGFSMANIIGQSGLGSDYDVKDESFYFSDTDVDENYTPSEGEVDEEEKSDNIDGEEDLGLSNEEEDLALSDVDLEGVGAINDTDSEGELFALNKNIERKRFHSHDNGKVKLEKNELFVDVYEFRTTLKDYIIQECFDIGYIKNEKTRVTTICEAEGCPWRIHASITPDSATFVIKSLNHVHTCVRNSMKNYATSTWIASKLYSSLKADPYMSYILMKNELKDKYGIEPHPMQLYRARRKVMEEVEGTHESSYKKLPKYAELLLDINHRSIVKLTYHDRNGNLNDKPKFKRMFICLEAFKVGFLKGCRPFIGVDGCHLKGPYGGILLAAVSLDANNGLLPIAYAIVEIECKDSWFWFLELLHDVIGDTNCGKKYTFMSDRQKGLVQAVGLVFPHAWHRCCAKHLFNNFKAKYPHVMLRDYFWAAVFAPSEKQFKEAMEKMSKVDNNAAKYLMETPVDAWSRHAFDPASKSPHVTNNMCESFNQWINKLRDKPPLILLDEMRIKLMIRWQKRYEIGCTCMEKVLPKIAKELSVINIASRACVVYAAGRDEYEVNDENDRHVVDLQGRTCGCTQWQISGMPCIHTAASILYKRAKIEDYVDVYYNSIAFLRSYDTIIHPMPSVDDILESDILAPPLRRLPGRPKKNRKRAKDEPTPSTIRKRLATVRCKNCQKLGHNSRGCQRAPIKAKRTPTTKAEGSTTTSSQRMTQTNMSAQQKLKLKMMEKKNKKKGMQQNL